MDIPLTSLWAVIPLLGNAAFFSGVAAAALALIAAIIFGVNQFQKPVGKFVAIAAGVVLIALLAFVLFVLFVSGGAERGAPL